MAIKAEEGNKLIAEFMGAEMPSCSKDPKGKIISCTVVYNGIRTDYIGDNAFPDNFKFNSDWNWLMPVIEKIEKLLLCVDI